MHLKFSFVSTQDLLLAAIRIVSILKSIRCIQFRSLKELRSTMSPLLYWRCPCHTLGFWDGQTRIAHRIQDTRTSWIYTI